MRSIYNPFSQFERAVFLPFLIAWNLLASFPAGAQAIEPDQVASVRLVNLVSPGEGRLMLKLDGSEPWPAGYELGQRTGAFGLKAGTHKFVLSKEGCLTAERELDLEAGKTVTLAIFGDPVENEEGEVIAWQIRLAELGQKSPGPGYFLTLVSFCPEKRLFVDVQPASGEAFEVPLLQRRATRRKFATDRERVAITHGDNILEVLKGRRAGNYVVMIYEGEEGKEAVSFYDSKFVLGE
jgi:hypothetical protein